MMEASMTDFDAYPVVVIKWSVTRASLRMPVHAHPDP